MSLSRRDAAQIIQAAWSEPNQALNVTNLTSTLVPSQYNEIDLTYIVSGNGAGQVGTAIYKLNGVQQAMLTLSYDSSNNLITVVKS